MGEEKGVAENMLWGGRFESMRGTGCFNVLG